MVVGALVLDTLHPSFVVLFDLFLLADVVADFHLPLYKVLGLGKRTDELLAFFALENANFLLVNHVSDFKLLFLLLQLVLFVNQLLAKDAFFVVQV